MDFCPQDDFSHSNGELQAVPVLVIDACPRWVVTNIALTTEVIVFSVHDAIKVTADTTRLKIARNFKPTI